MIGDDILKKRDCDRFSIPGTTLYYKDKPGLLIKHNYSDHYYPVLNMSKGGAKFLCNERLKVGKKITVKIDIPGIDQKPEILANIRWISKNPEQSYQYQTGIAFNSYGNKKNENPVEILILLESLEQNGKTNK
jgi:Tfp pilus assembly protein PilZ